MLLALAVPAAASADTWPTFHHDTSHSGLSSETAVNTTTAASLGVAHISADEGHLTLYRRGVRECHAWFVERLAG